MEMKAALKVLNDSIHRPQRASSKLLVNAIEIVRREWIRVAFFSLINCFLLTNVGRRDTCQIRLFFGLFNLFIYFSN